MICLYESVTYGEHSPYKRTEVESLFKTVQTLVWKQN
jgi:hypothetical protein